MAMIPKFKFLNEKMLCAVRSAGVSIVLAPALIRGSFNRYTINAIRISANAIPKYGYINAALEAWDSFKCERIKYEPSNGAAVVPIEPTPWTSVNLDDAVREGPKIVTYGFAATCSTTMPIAIINSAARNNTYWCNIDAGKNSKAPMAAIEKPRTIPFLYPILSTIIPAGIDMIPYVRKK